MAELYFQGLGNTPARRLTHRLGGAPHRARWSPDGHWLYYSSDRSGDWQIWRLSLGGGPREQITTRGGQLAQHDLASDALYLVGGEAVL